jgi:hypothetical protein
MGSNEKSKSPSNNHRLDWLLPLRGSKNENAHYQVVVST